MATSKQRRCFEGARVIVYCYTRYPISYVNFVVGGTCLLQARCQVLDYNSTEKNCEGDVAFLLPEAKSTTHNRQIW